ncbi:MAG: hypothetical protein GOVbin2277_60 [Prokaryotic dsDNA virus sp.]|jgi:Fe-S-cluster containining protein|nr:MAG: hypothetical protein GOVbin2277_60 [Prokaryotic dsDNA virus sp.]
MKYPCTMCGVCCRRLNTIESKLPHDETGRCDYLIDSTDSEGRAIGVCSVYDIRESLGCSTSASLKPKNMDAKSFFLIAAMGCNRLQEEEGLDLSYRVIIRDE